MATLSNAACRLVSKNAANCSLLASVLEVSSVNACFDSGDGNHLFFGDAVSRLIKVWHTRRQASSHRPTAYRCCADPIASSN